MSNREIRNAKIESTFLGYEDHGIFTVFLNLRWSGAGQGFGGYALDQYVGTPGPRRGTGAGLSFIMRCCDVVGVKSWEELPGKFIRIDHDHSKIYRIGHITDDKWFDPAEMFAAERPVKE